MSAGKIAIGAAVGLAAAAATTRIVDTAAAGQEHGVHIAMAMIVPAGIAAVAGGMEEGTVGRGALYGIAVGGFLATAFISTFTFAPAKPAGFFGERKTLTMETDPVLIAARRL